LERGREGQAGEGDLERPHPLIGRPERGRNRLTCVVTVRHDDRPERAAKAALVLVTTVVVLVLMVVVRVPFVGMGRAHSVDLG
jgi:hypothetical protein